MKRAKSPPAPEPRVLRLDPLNPQELLGLIPYLIGFRPSESFVLLLFDGRHLILTARMDLPPAEGAASLAGYCRDLAETYQASGVLAVVFSTEFAPATALLDRWRAAWHRADRSRERRARCPVIDALYADGRRWWSRATAFGRAQTEGTPYDPLASKAAADAVLAGLPTLGSRAELAALVAGPPKSDRSRLAALTAQAVRDLDPVPKSARQALMAELITGSVRAGPDPDDETCARLAVLADDIAVRDVAWSLITTDGADDHVALWAGVVRRTIDRYAVAPLALTGVAAWISGQGALMNCCIERAESLDDSYSMVALLAEINRRGIPPTAWQDLGPVIREEVWPVN